MDQNVCDILPDLAYEGCDSNPKLADLAKMVVDIECLSNQKATSQELGRVNKSGNQLRSGRPVCSTQMEGKIEDQLTEKAYEERSLNNNSGMMCRSLLDGSDESVTKETDHAPSVSEGSKEAVGTRQGQSREEGGQQGRVNTLDGSEDREAVEVKSLTMDKALGMGDGGGAQRSRSSSDENQIKEALINEGRGHSPTHLKFFLLVFSKLKRRHKIKRGSSHKAKEVYKLSRIGFI